MNILGMNIDWFKLMILLVIGLIVVGPEKLPSYARKTARLIRNFQKVITVLSGQFAKALDLDDEDVGNAPNYKKDLISIKKSLEDDVADLRATLDSQAKIISETVESGTSAALSSLKKDAREISDTVNAQAGEIKTTLDTQAKVVGTTVESSLKDDVSGQEVTTTQVTAPLGETSIQTADKSISEVVQEATPTLPSPVGEAEPG